MEKTKEQLRLLVPKDILDLYCKEFQNYQVKFGELIKIPYSLNNS